MAGDVVEGHAAVLVFVGQIGAGLVDDGVVARGRALLAVGDGLFQHFARQRDDLLRLRRGGKEVVLPELGVDDIARLTAAFPDDAAGGHEDLHIEEVDHHHRVDGRGAHGGDVVLEDAFDILAVGVAQALGEGGHVQIDGRRGGGQVVHVAHAHDAALLGVGGEFHGAAHALGGLMGARQVGKAVHRLADAHVGARARGALHLVEGGPGKAVGAFFQRLVALAKHDEGKGAALRLAGVHGLAGAVGQAVDGALRQRAPLLAAARTGEHDQIALCREREVQRPRSLQKRLHAFLAAHAAERLAKQRFAQKGRGGGQLPLDAQKVGLRAALLADAAGDALKHFEQLLRAHRLEQVFLYPQRNGLLGVGEVIVAGEDDDLHPRHGVGHGLAQLHAVHEGHADVGDEDVRLDVLHGLQGQFPVRGLAHEGEAVFLPREAVADALADDDLIVHQKDLIHRPASLPAA